ncbi:unnamed protein product [marine sediment metagenome]|uniref:Ribbon-helix-helix protein CopG domain-containing protein n=1 Tax=marine sediment metagenome TaxID=412755 RepID=X1BXV2_9ZZZZ
MVEQVEIDVYLTKEEIANLDYLVEKGIYLNRGEYIREGLRALFRHHGLEPFCNPFADKPESSG